MADGRQQNGEMGNQERKSKQENKTYRSVYMRLCINAMDVYVCYD